MGIDPLTHEPASSPAWQNRVPSSPSTRHMAQWESARLEAEARLSREFAMVAPSSSSSAAAGSEGDFFLRLWNSEVGETFRKVDASQARSPSCSSTKCSALREAGVKTEGMAAAEGECKSSKSCVEDVCLGSDSCSSNETEEEESESALQLLLDFPHSNDMSFLGQTDCYGYYF